MKPLDLHTFTAQAIDNSKGITWLDACRIPTDDDTTVTIKQNGTNSLFFRRDVGVVTTGGNPKGRFPANLLVSDKVLNDSSKYFDLDKWADTLPFLICPKASRAERNRGCENLPAKMPGNRIAQLENYDGRTLVPRANHHPTVKPIKLMSYLVTLGSMEGDVVLDPFCGSGTTCVAAANLERNFIGCEQSEEYKKIADARIEAA
jgi:DNA methylase